MISMLLLIDMPTIMMPASSPSSPSPSPSAPAA
ncbi:hypothetical protein GGD64_004001 [Bradyrhizobium sp. CIR3A]|nr:hypothetical protein [Bradyrhizobium sp. CIR3A]